MRRIIDITIALGVILGATGIATGYRWFGGISLFIALLIGWKRHWCLESVYDLIGSSGQSPGNDATGTDSDAAHVADTASSSETSSPD